MTRGYEYREGLITKGQQKGIWGGDGIVLYFVCSGGYMKLCTF